MSEERSSYFSEALGASSWAVGHGTDVFDFSRCACHVYHDTVAVGV